MYITYERKKTNITGINRINFNFKDINYYQIEEEQMEFTDYNIYRAKLNHFKKFDSNSFEKSETDSIESESENIEDENSLFISGNNPHIFMTKTKETFQIFENYNLGSSMVMEDNFNIKNYTFMLIETNQENALFLFVKEAYMLILLKFNSEETYIKNKHLVDNISEKKINNEQSEIFKFLLGNLNGALLIVDILGLEINGEIINVQLDSNKSLILINSSDKTLRLFKYDYDYFSLVKDYTDSVNRRKWVNAYFYTFHAKNSFQDLIVSALSDSNSLEFVFIDINTGHFIKRLEPYKYQCSDFIVHYTNHFSLVLISNKKLYHIYGYFINHWGAYAPKLKYIQENVEFIEDESFFDNFNQNLKKTQTQKLLSPKELIDIIVGNNSERERDIMNCNQNNNSIDYNFRNKYRTNLFFRFSVPNSEDDLSIIQAEKDIKEVFMNFGEQVEINKK